MKEYKIEENGIETTVLLSDEDAEKQGLSGGTAVEDVATKSEKGEKGEQGEKSEKSGDAPANKAQKGTANK